jgi:hypothetical protein
MEIGGEAPEQSRFFRFKVSADLPAKRTAEPNESPDDKKKKDDAFNKQQETLKTRLAAEQKLQNWIFEVESYSLETFLKPRKDILKEASPKPALNPGVLPKPAVQLPLAATPTPAVSPTPAVPSPSPKSSATPEATPTPETTATPEMTPSPETTPTPETKPTPETNPTPETKTTPETTPSPEAVPSSSPSPAATPET